MTTMSMYSNSGIQSIQTKAEAFFNGWLQALGFGAGDIFIKREYLTITDGNLTEAAILSRIVFWQDKLKVKDDDGNLVLAKNHDDWQQECGVGKYAARKALKRLEEKKVIRTAPGRFSGKNTVFIYLDKVVFWSLLNEDMSPATKGQVHLLQKDTSYTENTNTENTTKESVAPDKPTATETAEKLSEKATNPVVSKEEKASKKERYDAIAKAIMEHLHGLKDVPKEKGFIWKTVHKQAKEAAAFDWLEASHIEKFIRWYKKENNDAALPSSIEGFSIWITKYAAVGATASANGYHAHKPDPNCPICHGAGTVITKRGSIHESAEYGKCPACMAKSEVRQ